MGQNLNDDIKVTAFSPCKGLLSCVSERVGLKDNKLKVLWEFTEKGVPIVFLRSLKSKKPQILRSSIHF